MRKVASNDGDSKDQLKIEESNIDGESNEVSCKSEGEIEDNLDKLVDLVWKQEIKIQA